MVQLVLSMLELKPHFPRFLFTYKKSTMIQNRCKKCTHPLWPEQSGQMPTCCLTAYHSFPTCGVSCILSKNGAGGLHDVFQNWIRTKKCLKTPLSWIAFWVASKKWLHDFTALGRRQQIDPEVDEHRWVCSLSVAWSTGHPFWRGANVILTFKIWVP